MESFVGEAESLLSLRDLTVGQDGRFTTWIPDFDLAAGEGALLLGPSGSGKSTTLFTLAGLASALSGSARLGGEPIAKGAPISRKIGVVFQDVHLLAGLSVLDNVLLAVFAQGLPQDKTEAWEVLDDLGIGHLAIRRADTLSRGEAQRVAVARTILLRPALILADEPTASLDDANAARVADLLQAAAARSGAALLIATHDQRLRARFARQITLAPIEAAA